jgi:hypothetical protein
MDLLEAHRLLGTLYNRNLQKYWQSPDMPWLPYFFYIFAINGELSGPRLSLLDFFSRGV